MATRTSQLIVELLDRVSAPARGVASALKGIRGAAKAPVSANFTEALNGALARTNERLASARMGVVDAMGAFYALRSAIASPVASAMALESAMADVRKVVDFGSDAELDAFTRQLLDMTKAIPMGVEGLAQIAAAAGQAGIAKDDILAFTEAAAKVGVAFDISADQAGEAMAKMMTGLGMTLPEVVSLADAMNHLSNKQASSAAEILDVVRRVGAQGKQYGFTAEQVAAFGSAMIAAGAQSDVAATSFMNMGRALTRGASATKRQREAYKLLGMDAEKVALSMQKDATKTTITVMEAIAALPAEMRAAVASDLFGDEARALGPLLTNLGLVRESLGMVGEEGEYAGSAFKEFAVRAQTFENRLQLFRNALDRVKVTIGNALLPILTDLMDRIEPILDRIGEWISANPELVSGIMAAVAAVVALRGAVAALTFAGLLGKSGALTALAFGMNTVGRAGGAVWGAVSASVALQSALGKMDGQKVGLFTKLAAGLRGLASVTGLTAIKGAIAGVISVIGSISAPVWLAIAAAVAAVGAAWKYWDRISSFVAGVGRAIGELLAPVLEKIRPLLDWFAPVGELIAAGWERAKSALSGIGEWLSSLFTQEALSGEEKAKWENRGYQITMGIVDGIKRGISALLQAGADMIQSLWDGAMAKFNEFIEWCRGIPGRVISAIGTIDLSSVFSSPPRPDGSAGFGTGAGKARGKAIGGPIGAGRTYLVGEEGPELITPSKSGYVHTAGETKRMMGGGWSSAAGAATTINLGGVTVHAAPGQSAREVAAEAVRMIEDKIGAALRGVQADTGLEAY